jgi:excinuclease ABC subunit C
MSAPSRVEVRIRELPDRPGIYIFKGQAGQALYVGKAASLRKRALSYLGSGHEPRIATMLAEAVDLEAIVTDTEAEALLLENNWIKRSKPRFNVLLRDDKTYPYVMLSTGETYPRVALTRRLGARNAEYFGPYLPGGLARKAIKLVQKLFEIRICRIEIDGSLPRPCLYYDMKRCLGPCVDGLTSQAAYGRAVQAARLFLSGRTDELVKQLKAEMKAAAAAQEYERAAQVRDTIREIEAVSQRRKLSSVQGEDVDIYGIHSRGGNTAVCILVMRGGQVLDRRELFWEGEGDLSPEAVLSELLPQVYDRTSFVPREIHLPCPVEGEEVLVDWLSDRRGERVYLRLPSRGPKAQRVALAMRNAELAHKRRFRLPGPDADAGLELRRILDLAEVPRRIEGLDISNLQGEQIVASLVVWEGGRMRKGEYRSFNIRGLEAPDDYQSMRQAVERRYRRRLEELGDMPDLILVDGGRGQLNAALDSLAKLGVEETPLVALAKQEEVLYVPAEPEPLVFSRRNPGLRLLQQIRDEAHRFALSRHRRRRSSRSLRSVLDEIPGIGPKRRRKLLHRFGSVSEIRKASLAELQEAVGAAIGLRVYEHLADSEIAESAVPHAE